MTLEDYSKLTITNSPPDSDWECWLFGSKAPFGMVYCPATDAVPNWFWRLMQYLCFGNKWRKTK